MSKDFLTELILKLQRNENLDRLEARAAAFALAAPGPPDLEKRNFLIALGQKGESPEEVSFFAEIFRELAVDPCVDTFRDKAIDVCGTGGDKSGSFNLSTTTAMILATAGVPVFKHGNRSITSGCGSADLLERLGVPLLGSDANHLKALEHLNFTFFFAPSFHPAFKEIMPVRQTLGAEGVRTIFNLLGPLINPGRPAYQLLGVFSLDLVEPVAAALNDLGLKRGLVVHTELDSGKGMDELACCGTCHIAGFGEFEGIRDTWTPDAIGLDYCSLDDLRGGDLECNVTILHDILEGRANQGLMDSLCLNAGAALWIAEQATNLKEGLAQSRALLTGDGVRNWMEKVHEFYEN
ncbi:MAG: anthranilate phosphoribosyltransferase [Opitutae bacterium]|nr:anthranilate phosphoribosyltransferase [Opitutae bacterium]